jgi:hypothetical protein
MKFRYHVVLKMVCNMPTILSLPIDHMIRNQQVRGSNPRVGFHFNNLHSTFSFTTHLRYHGDTTGELRGYPCAWESNSYTSKLQSMILAGYNRARIKLALFWPYLKSTKEGTMVRGIGKAMGEMIIGLIVIAFVVGGGVVLGLYFLISWLIHHVHIAWG